MASYPKSFEHLVYELSKLPGIGPKSAQRLAFRILDKPKEEVQALSHALTSARENITACPRCFHFAEHGGLCEICSDDSRDNTVLCVVETPRDVIAMENSGGFRGRYHVLQGTISPMDGRGPEDIRIRELLLRLKEEPQVEEVILAVPSNVEGETTALYLKKLLTGIVKVTRLASGIPVGGDLEFADEITLTRALEGRREF